MDLIQDVSQKFANFEEAGRLNIMDPGKRQPVPANFTRAPIKSKIILTAEARRRGGCAGILTATFDPSRHFFTAERL